MRNDNFEGESYGIWPIRDMNSREFNQNWLEKLINDKGNWEGLGKIKKK